MKKLLTASEIKLITGINDADARVDYMQNVAVQMLASYLDTTDLIEHDVTFEKHKILNPFYIRTRSFPVNLSTLKIYWDISSASEITNYSFVQDGHDIKRLLVTDSAGYSAKMIYNDVYLSYTGGFKAQETVSVEDNSLVGVTLSVSVLGVETIYSFITTGTPSSTQILIGATATATATNIASKLGGTSLGKTATVPVGLSMVESDGSKLTVVNSNVPEDLKFAIAYIVSAMLSDSYNSGAIASYSLGGKSVSFRSDAEMNFVISAMEKYGSRYKDILINS